jgi:hypothetical protein
VIVYFVIRLNEHFSISGQRAYVHGMNEAQQKAAIDCLRRPITIWTVANPDPTPKRERMNPVGRMILTGVVARVKGDGMILDPCTMRSATLEEIAAQKVEPSGT